MKVTEKEVFFTWAVPAEVEGENKLRLLTPHGDPYRYESPFDLLFDSEEEAQQGLEEWGHLEEAIEDGWILCKRTLKPIREAE